jgi:hypothetical protein
VTRKRLRGVAPTQRAPAETYNAEWNTRTYADLGWRAKREIAASGGAIVDATFRHLADRRSFTNAFRGAGPSLFIECQAPRSILAQRATHRDQHRTSVSDADLEVVLREQHAWEPLDEVPASAHMAVRTDRPLDQVVNEIEALLDGRLLELALARQQQHDDKR